MVSEKIHKTLSEINWEAINNAPKIIDEFTKNTDCVTAQFNLYTNVSLKLKNEVVALQE